MRTIFSLTTVGLVLLAACTTDPVAVDSRDAVDAMLELPAHQRQQAYSLLTVGEKREAWVRHVAFWRGVGTWSPDQHRALAAWQRELARANLASGNAESLENTFAEIADGVFSDDERFVLTMTLARGPEALEDEAGKTYSTRCSCNFESRYTCGRIAGYISIQYGICDRRLGIDCRETGDGCGFLFLHPCDGSLCSYL